MKKFKYTYFSPKGFTLIELLVVISIIALLLSIMMPALTKVKRQGRKAICLSNIRQLNIGLLTYATQNSDKAFLYYDWKSGEAYSEPWYRIITEYIGDHKEFESGSVNQDQFDLLFCPEAKKVSPEAKGWEAGDSSVPGKAFHAWKQFNGAEGSYGFNNWLHTGKYIEELLKERGLEVFINSLFGKITDASGRVVTFVDCCWPGFMVYSTEAVALGYEPDYDISHNINTLDPMADTTVWSNWSGLARICTDRHNKAINMGFVDGSAATIKLEDIFLQKWSKSTRKYTGFSPWKDPWLYR